MRYICDCLHRLFFFFFFSSFFDKRKTVRKEKIETEKTYGLTKHTTLSNNTTDETLDAIA